MRYSKIPIFILAVAMSASTLVVADDDDDEALFEEAFLYFELNDTDGDLGIHGKVDGDAWKRVAIEGPNDRTIMKIRAKSGLRRQGLTELFFESAEPTFDELDPEVFFPRFPQGVYEWEGKTLDGVEIEGEVYLSHIIPAAPVVTGVGILLVGDNPGFEENDEGELEKLCWAAVDTSAGVLIEWGPVEDSHYDKWSNPANEPLENEVKIPLGDPGDLEDVAYYEFVAEFDGTEFKSTALIPPNVNQWTIPAEFIALAEGLLIEEEDDDGNTVVDENGDPVLVTPNEIKFEIIVRVETGDQEDDDGDPVPSTLGNQSAVEDCFKIVS